MKSKESRHLLRAELNQVNFEAMSTWLDGDLTAQIWDYLAPIDGWVETHRGIGNGEDIFEHGL